ncbi:sensor histidine kinase [Aquibacillus saliphilus]|uniref:sensor histidine kinase n=1 Tax=Aquibacillus saliphilus TaxID=1909422 RepID=UPI001CF0422F|nr:sensor histidine kinase [Aquibacillus saliphilus]
MYRHTYWLCLALLIGIWGFGLSHQFGGISEVSSLYWLGSAMFFSLYFILPLFHKQLIVQIFVLVSATLIIMGVFWPIEETLANYYVLLLYAYLAGEATFRLPHHYALFVGIVILASLLLPTIVGNSAFTIAFLFFYISILAFALYKFHSYYHQLTELKIQYRTLLHEYRTVKRKSISGEKLARQEERTQIGREIHDSVGHKLTNLLMQLEVARIQADDISKHQIELLKQLTTESLEETRRAVKALKQEEIGGIPAIISLIRKLEAERFIRIHFSVKNRAFSVQLPSEQIIAVYRAIQEALTNVMRHSTSKEASILFESPGESIFRFEVSNSIESDFTYREGYGLSSMKERVIQAGGTLEILVYKNAFILRGTFPVVQKEGA